jgi:hypothetical protein
MPNENTSTFELPYFSQCISGAIYSGVPFDDRF